MRVLIIPMSAQAQTAGTFSRTKMLVEDLKNAGVHIAMCAAQDMNYNKMADVMNFPLSIPMPLGLPKIMAVHMFPVAEKLGVTARKNVKSFEDVLYLTGNTDERYLQKSISEIRLAIQSFQPDIVYSEFNIAAIIAAKLEQKKIYRTASIPTQYAYANSPQYAKGLRHILQELQLPDVKSCLEVFEWVDQMFVPSIPELEPFQNQRVTFCGTWKQREISESNQRDKILVYMGNGTISKKKMVKEIVAAFRGTVYQVYIAGKGLENVQLENINMAEHFQFDELLSETLLFINHGGQNSMVDGLIYGVPQIICPGKVFERQYNADSLVRNHGGIKLDDRMFTADNILKYAQQIIQDMNYYEEAKKLGNRLSSFGGIKCIMDKCEKEIESSERK